MNAYPRLRKFSCVMLAVAALVMGTTAANAATAPGQTADEQHMSKQVRHALVTVPWYGVFDNLEYTINGSEVTLSGQVVQPVTKSDAESAVKHVEGVTRVVDNITVLPLSNFDEGIRRAEYRAIFAAPTLSRYSMGAVPAIHIIVDNGHVTLVGAVDNQADANVARIRALSVPGVFSVTNNLHVG
jgi:hyperosmotically inducible periplasmic protein